MRTTYYKLINDYQLPDILVLIKELSYTQKYKLLIFFIEKYSTDILRVALQKYREIYIDTDRVYTKNIKLHITKLCGYIKGEENEKNN